MAAKIICGDVFDVLPTLAAGSVDCVVTSPPYWMLRDYGTGTWEGGNDPACNHVEKMARKDGGRPATMVPRGAGGTLVPSGSSAPTVSAMQYRGTCPRCGARRIDKQLGMEPTPAEYVARMVEVFRLVRRAMAPHATCWVNIGDSYVSGPTGPRVNPGNLNGAPNSVSTKQGMGDKAGAGIPDGNLCLIPQRLAIALQDDGWLVRSVVVWHKPAPMPGSMAGWRWVRCRVKVKEGGRGGNGYARMMANDTPANVQGQPNAQWAPCPGCPKCLPNNGLVLRRGKWRPTSAWEPVLMLAKGPGYYADGEAVKTPAAAATVERDRYTRVLDDPDEQFAVRHDHETVCEGGANLRDVWTIAAEPLKESHYASFPSELVYRCLAAGTSAKGYCPACSAPWARVVEREAPTDYGRGNSSWSAGSAVDSPQRDAMGPRGNGLGVKPATTLGWKPSCGCIGADTFAPRPGRVLDPFAGSGRTGVQAQRLGLDFVGVELSPEYARMAERLLYEAAPLFQE